MQQLLYIGIAGFFGALARYLLSGWTTSVVDGRFPLGTMTVNVLGSLFLGFLYTLSVERLVLPPELKVALTVGFLGAFTTFSTFSLETYNLIREGSIFLSIVNIILNMSLGLAAVIAGVSAAKILYGGQ
ncbi:MAG: fluoride efflux transporter CrcB [Deltaproteobacteria bacterium]|nr:fluoride efflux transporter CrcB [Deltaproteobacteria bacterium]